MKRIAVLIFVFTLNYAPFAFAQDVAPRARVEAMFKSLKPGEIERVIEAFGKSTLVPPELVDKCKSQAKAVITLTPERAIIGFEFVQEQNIGESVKRLSYVLKLADRPLYWNFTFYKPGNAWVLLRMNFVEEP